jgi:virulence factor Mce-like protein
MKTRARQAFRNEVLVGALFLMVLGAAVWISYNASRGIPFLAAYRISVDVPDAQELVTSDQVRIGGARVGLVTRVRAIAPGHGRPAFARVDVALKPDVAELADDSHARIQAGSILGGKYLALYPGRSNRGIPDGGILPLRQARRVTDISQALRVFDRRSTAGVRGTVNEVGVGLAGRGTDLNETIGATRRMIGPLDRVLTVLARPSTNLRGFVDGAAATADALAPVAPRLAGLVEGGAVTFQAVNAAGPALARTLEAIPGTESLGASTLNRLRPVITSASATTSALDPDVRLLPATTRKLAAALRLGTAALHQRTHGLLDPAIASFDALNRDPATLGTIKTLAATVAEAKPTLRVLYPEQVTCNTFGAFFRNTPSALSEGDASGTWLRFIPILGSPQTFQSPSTSSDLHLNPYPHETARECEAGNETYSGAKRIGNIPGSQGTAAPNTHPPRSATRRARAAGLLGGGR